MNLSRVIRAWVKALRDFFHPKILLFSFLCFLIGSVFWTGFLILFGPPLLAWLSSLVSFSLDGFWGTLALAILTFPIVFLVALLILSVIAFPWVRGFLKSQGFRSRPVRGKLSLAYQVREMGQVSCVGVFLWIVALLLFWMPPVAALLSFATLAWVQWRLLSVDFWSESESPETLKDLRSRNAREGMVLSAGLALGAGIPIFNLFLPILSALAFAHWDQELQNES